MCNCAAGDSNTNSDTYPNPNSNTNANSYSHPNTYSQTNPDSNPNSDSDSNADTNGDTDAYTYAERVCSNTRGLEKPWALAGEPIAAWQPHL